VTWGWRRRRSRTSNAARQPAASTPARTPSTSAVSSALPPPWIDAAGGWIGCGFSGHAGGVAMGSAESAASRVSGERGSACAAMRAFGRHRLVEPGDGGRGEDGRRCEDGEEGAGESHAGTPWGRVPAKRARTGRCAHRAPPHDLLPVQSSASATASSSREPMPSFW
jgi:hypothetical protein